MTNLIAAGLVLAMAAGVAHAGDRAADPVHHNVTLDHHSGPVDARYRGDIRVAHRQVGSVAPAGRQPTLRCAWSASLVVDRHARTASGATASRSFARDDVLTGTRPGWCSTHRAAIAQEVAARLGKGDHLRAMAREDHDVLRAELDRAHAPTREG